MKYKTITALLILGATKLAFAYDSTATAPVVCPSSITCDYDKGKCDQPDGSFLMYYPAQEPFTGVSEQSIELSDIGGGLASLPSMYPHERYEHTSLFCSYRYGKSSSIGLIFDVKRLIGANWVFSGFGKQVVHCSDISDPSQCAGEK
jgi:hypothetical protein